MPSSEPSVKPEVWLTMIIRNEAAIIRRCLRSVQRYISGYVIVDTGSTDETRSTALATLASHTGRYVSSEWTGDFARHRNEALSLARGLVRQPSHAWFLTIDADETLVGDLSQVLAAIGKGVQAVCCYAENAGYFYLKTLSARTDEVVSWKGRVHEYLTLASDATVMVIDPQRLKIRYGNDGARRKSPVWSEQDLKALELEPDDDFRHAYFRARTLEAAGQLAHARTAYHAAKACAVASEDQFQATWGELRVLMTRLQASRADASALAAQLIERSAGQRAEPLVALAEIALDQGQYDEAISLAQAASACPAPLGTAMYDGAARTWKPRLIAAQAAACMGRREACIEFAERALGCRGVPSNFRRQLRRLCVDSRISA